MNLRKITFRLLSIGTIAASTTALSASAANAGVGVSTTGASLTCNTYNDGNGLGHADCILTDTAADSHSVYALMHVDGYAGVRYNDTGGSGTRLNFTYWFGTDTLYWDFYYRACRNVQFGSDNCSAWVDIHA